MGAYEHPLDTMTRNTPTPDHDDAGAANIIGMLVILPAIVMASLSVMWAVTDWSRAVEDHVNAEADRAEKAAWCARHPGQPWPGNGTCPGGPTDGWTCDEDKNGTVVYCYQENKT